MLLVPVPAASRQQSQLPLASLIHLLVLRCSRPDRYIGIRCPGSLSFTEWGELEQEGEQVWKTRILKLRSFTDLRQAAVKHSEVLLGQLSLVPPYHWDHSFFPREMLSVKHFCMQWLNGERWPPKSAVLPESCLPQNPLTQFHRQLNQHNERENHAKGVHRPFNLALSTEKQYAELHLISMLCLVHWSHILAHCLYQ